MKEGIVVLHGPGSRSPDSQARLEHGLDIYEKTGMDLVLSGGWDPEVVAETEYEISSRHDGALRIENISQETIGNALWSRTDVVVPQNYSRIQLVTGDYHMPRAAGIFTKVMGEDSYVEPSPAETPFYDTAERLKLNSKEAVMRAASALILKDYSTDPETVEHMKEKVQAHFLFRSRYHDEGLLEGVFNAVKQKKATR